MSINDTIAQDKDIPMPAQDTVRSEYNKLLADALYAILQRPAFQVAAAAVAPPVCATGTTKSKVKTTATSQFFVGGVPKSLTATDDLWTLTGANLAAGSVRRYQLCWTGATGTTVVSVRPSDDQVIADYADSATALAACRWENLPPQGTVIVGVLSIVNTTNAFVPGTTLLDATGVTATYRDGYDANCFLASAVSR